MAGVGFKLRRMVSSGTFGGIVKGYGYTGFIAAGPWISSLLGVLIVIFVIHKNDIHSDYIKAFQVSVTHLTVWSLIGSSFFLHSFTRFVSDSIFKKNMVTIFSSFMSVFLFVTALYSIMAYFLVDYLFPQTSFFYRLFSCVCFVLMVNNWICTNLLSGLKRYSRLGWAFFLGYLAMVVIAYLLRKDGLDGLMFSFMMTQFIIFTMMIFSVFKEFFIARVFSNEYLSFQKAHSGIIFVSFFIIFGTWIDKNIFWYFPSTSEAVIGVWRFSEIYDIPSFFSFIAIIPAFIAFIFRMESDFAIYYEYYFDAVREGGTYLEILKKRDQMVLSTKECFKDVFRVQIFVIFLVFLFGKNIFEFFNLSPYHYYLFRIDCISASFFLVLLIIFNILFYMDKVSFALKLSIFFCLTNGIFTLITIKLGILYYGFGFLFSLFFSCLIGLLYLNNYFLQIEFKTFMKIR